MSNTVSIRPGISVLSVLRHLNYKMWYALGEFVDNSMQSYFSHSEQLKALHGDTYKLQVDIDIDAGASPTIVITDNAAGIFHSEYDRAFRPAAIPPERSGLAEFGMGMKSAACWFAPKWQVRTTAIGETVERTVQFDIDRIVNDNIEELQIQENNVPAEHHYTEIRLENVFHVPVGRTIGKLKEHITDIYREFMRRGVLDLRYNGESLRFKDPRVLRAPYFKNEDGPNQRWYKPIDFDFGNGLSVHGFAALREKGDTKRAGFSLFRRGRVIQGSGDEGYRPQFIFGTSNSFRYQRLFGELHLEGFDVSHTKDGFRWDENEQPFLEILKDHLDSGEIPLLKQAEGYRALPRRPAIKATTQDAVRNTADVMQKQLPDALTKIDPTKTPPKAEDPVSPIPSVVNRTIDVTYRNTDWKIALELHDSPAQGDWLIVNNRPKIHDHPRCLDIRISVLHPFMVRFAQSSSDGTEAIIRLGCALAIAEVLAGDTGTRYSGTVRRIMNELLRDVFSFA